jgi:hypothetical protein
VARLPRRQQALAGSVATARRMACRRRAPHCSRQRRLIARVIARVARFIAIS